MSHPAPMPAQATPPIDARQPNGQAFTAPAAPEGGLSMIFFYRGVHCPVCKTQIEELALREDEFRDAGLVVSAVSMDDGARFGRQAADWTLGTLTVGHGLSEAAARGWGLYISDQAKAAEPARFAEPGIAVIRPDGTIYALFLQNTPFARPRLDDLKQGLGYVLKNDYPVRGTA